MPAVPPPELHEADAPLTDQKLTVNDPLLKGYTQILCTGMSIPTNTMRNAEIRSMAPQGVGIHQITTDSSKASSRLRAMN